MRPRIGSSSRSSVAMNSASVIAPTSSANSGLGSPARASARRTRSGGTPVSSCTSAKPCSSGAVEHAAEVGHHGADHAARRRMS